MTQTNDDMNDALNSQGGSDDLRAALIQMASQTPDTFAIEQAAEQRWMSEITRLKSQHAEHVALLRSNNERVSNFFNMLSMGGLERRIPLRWQFTRSEELDSELASTENNQSDIDMVTNILNAAEKGCDFQIMLDAILANDDYRGQWERLVMLMGLTENTED
jgi:hypothetical protein